MFLLVTRAQAKTLRRALREQDGLPAKGVTVGPCTWGFVPAELQVDDDGEPLSVNPGWSVNNLPEADEDGDTLAIEVPQRLEKFAGKTVKGVKLPALVAEADLPEGVKVKRAAKRDAATVIDKPAVRSK